jgi:hypothetical protein
MIPCKSFTFPINPHSTIPPQPVGSSRIWSAATTSGSGKLNRSVPPPASAIPLRMQPTARSPPVVRVLSELTRTSHDDTKAACKSLHVLIQSIPSLCEEGGRDSGFTRGASSKTENHPIQCVRLDHNNR